MTRILVVDDDHRQLRMLARLISMRRRDLTVLMASDGHEAIEVLQSGPVDFVLTDLQMPEMNGLELLAWMSSHQPHVPAYSMTAYPDTAAMSQLGDLGSIECFTKPIDVAALLERLTDILAEGTRGQVHNIGLPSFLQLLSMERKTCALTVESGERVGHLYLQAGELVDARTERLEGRCAATTIIAWESPSITILSKAPPGGRRIEEPLGFLIMEAMRIEDEAEPRPEEPERANPIGLVPLDTSVAGHGRAVVIFAADGERMLAAGGDFRTHESLCRAAAHLFEREVQEIVLTGVATWLVARPMEGGELAALVFEPRVHTLPGARRALAAAIALYATSRVAAEA